MNCQYHIKRHPRQCMRKALYGELCGHHAHLLARLMSEPPKGWWGRLVRAVLG